MKNFSLPALIDGVCTAIFGFIFFFVVVSYFAIRPYSIIIALSLTTLAVLLIVSIDLKKWRKLNEAKKQKFETEAVLAKLDFLNKPEIINLFFDVFEKQNLVCEKRKNYLYLPDKKTAIFFSFGFENKSKAEIVKAYNNLNNGDTAEIYASEFPQDIKDFASRFGGKIKLKHGIEIYELLKKTDCLPSTESILFPLKEPLKIKKKFFVKKRAKSFISFGTMFLLMSYFVPIKLYYVISGGIMLILGFLCLIIGKTEQTPQN